MTMTPFEERSLWLGAAALLLTLITVSFGLYQLRQLVIQVKAAVDANRLSQLDALLQIERNLADSRNVLKKAGLKLVSYKENDTVSKNDFEVAVMDFNEAKQTHFNALDRLCATILSGLLDETQLRPEYRDYISDLVKEYPEDFGTTTPYRSVMKLYNTWADN